jgi:lipopolysaccharide/colanic/teichoic acid biosynthesis glycosyltransferase
VTASERDPLKRVGEKRPGDSSANEEHVYLSRSSWPATRLTATTATFVLGIAITAPSVIRNLNAPLWPTLLLPALLATLAGRLVFESIDGGVAAAGIRAHLLGAFAGSLVAVALMTAASLVLGLHTLLLGDSLTLALAALALLGAGLVRDLEIRMRLALRRVYFAGAADSLRELQHELIRSPEASLVGAVGAHPPLTADALAETISNARATVLVLDRAGAHASTVVAAAEDLGRRGVRVRDLLTYYEAEFKKVPLTELTPAWFLFERVDQQRRVLADAARRITMMLLSALLLVISMPLLAALMLAIRLTSPGPVIFRQTRVGKDGALFTLVKLRTMLVADPSASDDAAWATDEDHRITPLGRRLRRYRLDELPQLWNVMRGELALIGPRPEQVAIVERLEREIPFYAARHTVRPGLTGWAQVNLGYSGSLEGARAKLQRDLYYVKHRGLRLDLLVLWLTLKTVFTDPR